MGQFGTDGKSIIPISITDDSGSFVVLKPGIPSSSFNNPTSMSIAIRISASFSIETDPEDANSVQFRIPSQSAGTSNDRIAFYISSSGKIGIGTKDPETAFDVRDNTEDTDPRRGTKTNILKLSKTSQRFDTPVTASLISSSGNIIGNNITGESLNIGSSFSVSSGGSITTLNNVIAGNSSTFDTHTIRGKTTLSGNVTASGNISGSSTSNITIGGNFIGNNVGSIYDDYIYLTPTDFDHLTDKGSILIAGEIEDNGGNIRDNNARGGYHAQKIIPKGYKATHVKILGSSTSDTYLVYSSSFNVGTAFEVGNATNPDTEKDITDVIGGNGTYISIRWNSRGNTEIYGGYIKITKI